MAAMTEAAMIEQDRANLHREWAALREAARKSHEPGPGGSVICICGAACGGSRACNMLGRIRDLVRYIPVEDIKGPEKGVILALREVM